MHDSYSSFHPLRTSLILSIHLDILISSGFSKLLRVAAAALSWLHAQASDSSCWPLAVNGGKTITDSFPPCVLTSLMCRKRGGGQTYPNVKLRFCLSRRHGKACRHINWCVWGGIVYLGDLASTDGQLAATSTRGTGLFLGITFSSMGGSIYSDGTFYWARICCRHWVFQHRQHSLLILASCHDTILLAFLR